MITALRGLGDARLAACKHACEEHGTLHLRTGYGREVLDWGEVATGDNERRAAVRALCGDRSTHLHQRFDDTPHRAFREGGITDEPAAERLARKNAGQEAHRRSRVAAVDVARGFCK